MPYGNYNSSGEYNSSAISVSTLQTVLNNVINSINGMIRNQKVYEEKVENIADFWYGGGYSKNSPLNGAVTASKTMYNQMSLGIAYGMELVASVKAAGEHLAQTYSGDNSIKLSLHSFSEVKYNFEAENKFNRSTDHMFFDSKNVVALSEYASLSIKDYLSDLSDVGTEITKVSDGGLQGTSLNNIIGQYYGKIQGVVNNINDAHQTYKNKLKAEYSILHTAEVNAGNNANMESSLGQTADNTNDEIMNNANSLISAVNSEGTDLAGSNSFTGTSTSSTGETLNSSTTSSNNSSLNDWLDSSTSH